MKTNRTIRFSPDQLAHAERLEVDISDVCRRALNLELHLRENPSLTGKRKDNFILNFFKIRGMQDDLEKLIGIKRGKK